VRFAGTYKTPMLQIVGRRDTGVPRTQGLEYHHALWERNVESVLAIYPHEGPRSENLSGVRRLLHPGGGLVRKGHARYEKGLRQDSVSPATYISGAANIE